MDGSTSRRVGPSPRGRGNRRLDHLRREGRGAIPAWAGEPADSRVSDNIPRGHPRVGGGTRCPIAAMAADAGPSPRGRGNRQPLHRTTTGYRAIPAWAGEPSRRRPARCSAGGHPRVGGGTRDLIERGHLAPGPSPRGRGNHRLRAQQRQRVGAIPAWAGEPQEDRLECDVWAGHPRVGGGTGQPWWKTRPALGPSPRGRGNPARRLAAGGE